jgi:hypothetical protein
MPQWQPQAHGRGGDAFDLKRAAVAQVRDDQKRHVYLAADQQMFQVFAGILDGRYLDRRKGAPEPG